MRNKIKHIILIIVAILMLSGSLFSQVTETLAGENLDSLINSGQICFDPVSEKDTIYIFVEQMPEYPGGQLELRKYIAKNLVYPTISHNGCGIQGSVFLRFEVMKTGEIGKIEIQKGIDPLMDEAALNVIKSLPKFTPGMQNGKPVNVWYSLPIKFTLN